MMQEASIFETPGNLYQNTRQNNPEDCRLRCVHCLIFQGSTESEIASDIKYMLQNVKNKSCINDYKVHKQHHSVFRVTLLRLNSQHDFVHVKLIPNLYSEIQRMSKSKYT
jgi:hypothetical protein